MIESTARRTPGAQRSPTGTVPIPEAPGPAQASESGRGARDSAPEPATDARGVERAEARGAERAEALAILGPSVTAPRRAIVEVMLASNRLRTPEDLLREARTRAQATSLATVYRTLERLTLAGRVKRATLSSGAVGYAYCGTGHHEHAICLGCGELRPVSPCLISGSPEIEAFSVTSHVLDFYGRCDRCVAEDA